MPLLCGRESGYITAALTIFTGPGLVALRTVRVEAAQDRDMPLRRVLNIVTRVRLQRGFLIHNASLELLR